MGRLLLGGALAVLLCAATLDALITGTSTESSADAAATYPDRRVSIMAPADPGGGWDETARALQQTIRESDAAPGAEVYNVGGAGGTLGLSQLVSKERGEPYELMVMGLVMLGAVETNRSPVTLDEVTPIAGLTYEPEVIVVRDASPFRDLGDVVEALRRSPGGVSVGGGSAGGTDQLLLGQLAKAIGVEPSRTRYVAHSGGGEATAAILSGSVDVGISGVSEFNDQVRAGKMRVLAVSSGERVEVGARPAPTMREQEVDVELLNWRGIVAPPGISEAERTAIVRFVERVRATPEWAANEKRFGWTRFDVSGDAFATLLDREQRQVAQLVGELGLADA